LVAHRLGRDRCESAAALDAVGTQIAVEFRFRDPFVTEARKRFQMTALEQIQHGLFADFQLAGDFVGSEYFHGCWLVGVCCPASSGHEATHAVKRGKFKEAGLAERHSPTRANWPGWREDRR
jgi:hypothetical protein